MHGQMNLGELQVLDLNQDAIATMKIFFTSGSTAATPQVTGVSLITKKGSSLAVGAAAATFSSFAIPDKEIFVGFIGSSGDWVDSLGPITRNI